ncbi:MAG: carboxymuconolactone decarboxylase family protein [Rickettsiales bacterium]
MNVSDFRKTLPDYAKDIRLNLSSALSEEGAPGLSAKQIAGSALASAYATRDAKVTEAVRTDAAKYLSDAELEAAKAAATIMGMTNIYYRFLHLTSDPEFQKMPANLRMDVIARHGIEGIDFELMSLAVSVVNGCGFCVDAHVKKALKHGITREGVQSVARIASVVHAAAQASFIG